MPRNGDSQEGIKENVLGERNLSKTGQGTVGAQVGKMPRSGRGKGRGLARCQGLALQDWGKATRSREGETQR